jgi:hypothetical protein
MTAPLRLDPNRAAAIAVARLAEDPQLAARVRREAGGATSWQIRADLGDDGRVTLSGLVGARRIGLCVVPRSAVEREP